MAQHLEAGANVLQHLGHIFAQLTEPAAAVGAGVMIRHVGVNFARKMLGQGTATRLRRCGPLCGSCRLSLFDSTGSLQVFELELQLLDLAQHLLALPAEQHLVQLRDQQHQPFDLAHSRTQALLLNPGMSMLMKNDRLQRCRIKSVQIGQAEGLGHVRSMP